VMKLTEYFHHWKMTQKNYLKKKISSLWPNNNNSFIEKWHPKFNKNKNKENKYIYIYILLKRYLWNLGTGEGPSGRTIIVSSQKTLIG
jgi:hypothetical protein